MVHILAHIVQVVVLATRPDALQEWPNDINDAQSTVPGCIIYGVSLPSAQRSALLCTIREADFLCMYYSAMRIQLSTLMILVMKSIVLLQITVM